MELAVVARRTHRLPRLVLTSLAAVIAALVLALSLPPALGLTQATVGDDAMAGSMIRGAAVFSKELPAPDLAVGDVITFPSPGADERSVVTRRVVKIDAGLVWTKSDRTGEIDPWTVALDDAARARAVVGVPYAGYVYDALDGGSRLVGRAFSGLR